MVFLETLIGIFDDRQSGRWKTGRGMGDKVSNVKQFLVTVSSSQNHGKWRESRALGGNFGWLVSKREKVIFFSTSMQLIHSPPTQA